MNARLEKILFGTVAICDRAVEFGRTRSRGLLSFLFNFADRCVSEFLRSGLTPAEKSRLGVYLYDSSRHGRGTELFPWEGKWFRDNLPRPPAKLLVAACGGGREAQALVAAGYAVDAFDPAPGLAALAGQRLGGRACVAVFSYEAFAAVVLDGAPGTASTYADKRYDAVLLGWGSFTHVLVPEERARLLKAVFKVCPKGPILASFWMSEDEIPPKVRGIAAQLGRTAGRILAAVRGAKVENLPGLMFAGHTGFGHVFTAPEIHRLAESTGRNCILEKDGYARVVLTKGSAQNCSPDF